MLTLLLVGHSLTMQPSVSVLCAHAPFILHRWNHITPLSLSGLHIRASAARVCASHRWWDHKALIKIQSRSFIIVASTHTESTRTWSTMHSSSF